MDESWHTDSARLHCPYCDERIEVVVDPSAGEQCYIEDCSVCCRPMLLTVTLTPQGGVAATAAREDD